MKAYYDNKIYGKSKLINFKKTREAIVDKWEERAKALQARRWKYIKQMSSIVDE